MKTPNFGPVPLTQDVLYKLPKDVLVKLLCYIQQPLYEICQELQNKIDLYENILHKEDQIITCSYPECTKINIYDESHTELLYADAPFARCRSCKVESTCYDHIEHILKTFVYKDSEYLYCSSCYDVINNIKY